MTSRSFSSAMLESSPPFSGSWMKKPSLGFGLRGHNKMCLLKCLSAIANQRFSDSYELTMWPALSLVHPSVYTSQDEKQWPVHVKCHHTPVVFFSWGLGCWQSSEVWGWCSDPEFSYWPAALREPAGFLQPQPETTPAATQCYFISEPATFFRLSVGSDRSFTLSIIIWADGRTLSRASVQLSQGWAKTPSIVNLSSGFTFRSLTAAEEDKRE